LIVETWRIFKDWRIFIITENLYGKNVSFNDIKFIFIFYW